MLTHPSDPPPQIVCPMDEDAIPPNRFCSAPSLSEPPPPLPSFSSTTPSCTNDGTSGQSGRIQETCARTPKKQSDADSGAAQKPPTQNPSPPKRQWESESMVQAWESKQPRVESTHENETQREDGPDLSYIAECQNEQNDDKPPWIKTNISAVEGVVEQFSDNTTPDLETTLSDMDACGSLAVGNAPVPKGWVIGPLFQSFKSKMASFTEIVMSPVKLFRAHSPPPSMNHPDKLDECEPQADETSDAEHSKPSNAFNLEAKNDNNQGANANQQRPSAAECPQDAKNVASNYSKDLLFEAEVSALSSEQADECALSQKEKSEPDAVPLHHSPLHCIVSEDVSEPVGPVLPPVLLQPAVDVSASHESKLKVSSAKQKGKLPVQLKSLPRKRTGNRKKATANPVASDVSNKESEPAVIDEQLPPINVVKSTHSSDGDKILSLSSSVCYAQPECDYGRKMDDCHLVPQSLPDNLKNAANGRPHVVLQQLDTYLAADLGRAKRQLNLDCHSQDFVKRKRLSVDVCRMEITNVASDRRVLRGLRPPRKAVVSTNAAVDGEERPRPARRRQAVSSRSNRRKDGQEVLTALSERVLNAQTRGSCDPVAVCSLDQTNSVSEDKQKGSNKVKPSGPGKRLKTRTVLGYPNVNMDLETTFAITSTKQAEEERLSEALVRPDKKRLQSTKKCSDVNKKPPKRKSPNQASSNPESDGLGVSASSVQSVEPLEVMLTDVATNQQRGETGLKQPSKRTRKAVKSSAPSGSQETEQCVRNLHPITKESPSEEENGKISTDPVYFEMTPFESDQQTPPPSSQPHLDHCVQLNNVVEHLIHREERGAASVGGETSEFGNHSSLTVSRPRQSKRRVGVKPRRADRQRRKCGVLHSSMCKGEEGTKSSTLDNADVAAAGARSAENSLWSRLLRSYSCPEIPSHRSFNAPGHSAHPSRTHSLHRFSHTPFPHHAHKSLHRARRHTVSSVEVEREFAPLCLRKEVYPSRRSLPYDGVCPNLCPSLALSPSSSLSPLASRFLSSPLAFLSKKADGRGAAAGPGAPPTSSSIHPRNPSTWHLSGFLQRSDSPAAASSSSGVSPECEIERRQQSDEEDDGENMSSSSQEFEDVALREEKALSDSEIKVVRKHEERGKVSSIRIRKTLPKPQNNLTPMGLPKPIRLKKKEFSLEEIYTNKNFSKAPESRLETIFEVPLNRRNGSESWFGQRRLKRYLEFLEVGEARKPKKPLVGVGKAGMSSSRTRRGGFPKQSVSVQDVDSLLCAKLDQLTLWLMHDQSDS